MLNKEELEEEKIDALKKIVSELDRLNNNIEWQNQILSSR